MSAILQRGDRIHLAIPTDPRQVAGHVSQSEVDRVKAEIADEARKSAQELTKFYRAEGVEVVIWSSNSQLTAPTVVAIFRTPAGEAAKA